MTTVVYDPELLAASHDVLEACEYSFARQLSTIYVTPEALSKELKRKFGPEGFVLNPHICPNGPRLIYGYVVKFIGEGV